MKPETENYLRATRRLADAAKAHSPRVSTIRVEVGQAQAAWVDAGCPDCPPEPARVVVFTCGGGR
jgi:hypothetical protein